jgi:chitinase
MKVEARDVHFLSSDGDLETIQPRENPFVHFRVDLRALAVGPKLGKGLAFEGSDHRSM